MTKKDEAAELILWDIDVWAVAGLQKALSMAEEMHSWAPMLQVWGEDVSSYVHFTGEAGRQGASAQKFWGEIFSGLKAILIPIRGNHWHWAFCLPVKSVVLWPFSVVISIISFIYTKGQGSWPGSVFSSITNTIVTVLHVPKTLIWSHFKIVIKNKKYCEIKYIWAIVNWR